MLPFLTLSETLLFFAQLCDTKRIYFSPGKEDYSYSSNVEINKKQQNKK
jgi:hypothetical protein